MIDQNKITELLSINAPLKTMPGGVAFHLDIEEALLTLSAALKVVRAAQALDPHLTGGCPCKAPVGYCFKAMRDLIFNSGVLEPFQEKPEKGAGGE